MDLFNRKKMNELCEENNSLKYDIAHKNREINELQSKFDKEYKIVRCRNCIYAVKLINGIGNRGYTLFCSFNDENMRLVFEDGFCENGYEAEPEYFKKMTNMERKNYELDK